MKFLDHKDLGNHLLQLCPKVVKHLYIYVYIYMFVYKTREKVNLCSIKYDIEGFYYKL